MYGVSEGSTVFVSPSAIGEDKEDVASADASKGLVEVATDEEESCFVPQPETRRTKDKTGILNKWWKSEAMPL